jgi:hypothetical protein
MGTCTALIQPCRTFDGQGFGHAGITQVEVPSADLDVEPIGDFQLQIADLAGGKGHRGLVRGALRMASAAAWRPR